MAYLKRIPSNTLKGFFGKTELDTGTFSEILRTLDDRVSGPEDCKWAHTFMMDLSKSFKFDMTIMFAEDEENEYIRNIVNKIRAVDTAKACEVQEAYED